MLDQEWPVFASWAAGAGFLTSPSVDPTHACVGVHEQVNVKCVYLFMCERVPVLMILSLCLHAGKRDRRLSRSMDVAQVELGLQRRGGRAIILGRAHHQPAAVGWVQQAVKHLHAGKRDKTIKSFP